MWVMSGGSEGSEGWRGGRREDRRGVGGKEKRGRAGDSLILLPVVGMSGGKRKRTVVTSTYAIPSCHYNQPRFFTMPPGFAREILLQRR